MFDKHPEELRKIGFLIYLLIRIESNLNGAIQIIICDFNDLKQLVLNQALLDQNIWGDSIERKRKFFLKIIEYINNKSESGFEYKRWKDFCSDLQKVQEIRNKLAHQFYSFSKPDKVNYIKRSKSKEKDKETFPFDTNEIDLDKEIESSLKLYNKSKLDEFLTQALPVIAKSQRVNLSEIWN